MNGPQLINIKTEDAVEPIYVTRIHDDIYRCEDSMMLSEINYHDEIELARDGDKFKIIRIVRRSPFLVKRYLLSKELIEAGSFQEMMNKLVKAGGYWERVMGGILILSLPKEKKEELGDLWKMIEEWKDE